MIRQRHRVQHVLPVFRRAEEQVERLRKYHDMLATLDEDRFQRGEHVGTMPDLDDPQRVERIDDRPWPDRQSRGSQCARETDDVVGDAAGRRIEMIDRHEAA
jgi:hypothetical protein